MKLLERMKFKSFRIYAAKVWEVNPPKFRVEYKWKTIYEWVSTFKTSWYLFCHLCNPITLKCWEIYVLIVWNIWIHLKSYNKILNWKNLNKFYLQNK